MIWFEHILLHDRFAKGLGTSSENLERLLLYNIKFIQLNEQNGKVTRLIFQIYILHVLHTKYLCISYIEKREKKITFLWENF